MGSGMLPVGAYVTLEHEHILILRKENLTQLKKNLIGKEALFLGRKKCLVLWQVERHKRGFQATGNKNIRERSGAYPVELAYRLINMFSIQGDIVLDPYLGTGTTTLGAMASGRNSIGV